MDKRVTRNANRLFIFVNSLLSKMLDFKKNIDFKCDLNDNILLNNTE